MVYYNFYVAIRYMNHTNISYIFSSAFPCIIGNFNQPMQCLSADLPSRQGPELSARIHQPRNPTGRVWRQKAWFRQQGMETVTSGERGQVCRRVYSVTYKTSNTTNLHSLSPVAFINAKTCFRNISTTLYSVLTVLQ